MVRKHNIESAKLELEEMFILKIIHFLLKRDFAISTKERDVQKVTILFCTITIDFMEIYCEITTLLLKWTKSLLMQLLFGNFSYILINFKRKKETIIRTKTNMDGMTV